jgi:hypothetical protein
MIHEFQLTTVDSKNTARVAWKLLVIVTLLMLLIAYWLDSIYWTILIIPLVILVTNYAVNQSLNNTFVRLTEDSLTVDGKYYSFDQIERLNYDDDGVLTYLLRVFLKDKTTIDIHVHTTKKNLEEFNRFHEMLKSILSS